jgi:hypothetical protein
MAAAASKDGRKVVVIGKLPGEIRGVQALKNGFQDCMEFNVGHPVNLEFAADWPTVKGDAAYLGWDDVTDQLQSINDRRSRSRSVCGVRNHNGSTRKKLVEFARSAEIA